MKKYFFLVLLLCGFVISACGGGGGTGSGGGNTTTYYGYVTNYGDSTLSIYSVNLSTGALAGATTFSPGQSPLWAVAHPSGPYLYVLYADGYIRAYRVSKADGSLTLLGTAVPAGSNVVMADIDPAGKYVYVVNSSTTNSLHSFSVNADGSLTSVSTFNTDPATDVPAFLKVSHDGNYVFVTYGNTNKVAGILVINGTFGSSTTSAAIAGANWPSSMAVSPDNSYLYFVCGNGGNVFWEKNDMSTGGAVANASYSKYILQTGNYVYSVNTGGDSISAYHIKSDNTLEATVSGSPYSLVAGAKPVALQTDPSGTYLFVVQETAAAVNGYRIASSGQLTSLGSPASTGTTPKNLAIVTVP